MALDDAGLLYVVGSFNEAGGQPSVGVARWDGVSWERYGNTFNGTLTHVAVAEDAIYVASWAPWYPRASQVNGEPLTSVAMLKDGQWQALPGMFGSDSPQSILDIATDGSNLYVSGRLEPSDLSDDPAIAMWDGQTWTDVSGGYTFDQNIWDMEFVGQDLYVAGFFDAGPDAPASDIARWDGTTWHPIGNDDFPSSSLRDILIDGDVIYARGSGTYRWENDVWENLDIGGSFSAEMVVKDTSLFIGSGRINMTEEILPREDCSINFDFNFSSIVVYEGGNLSPLGTGTYLCPPPDFGSFWGFDMTVQATALGEKGLFIAGDFTYTGGISANHIGYWSFDLAEVSTEEELPLDKDATLSHPYPNPFQGRVGATFTLTEPQHVTLEVFNVLGQRIVTLIDGVRSTGSHSVEW